MKTAEKDEVVEIDPKANKPKPTISTKVFLNSGKYTQPSSIKSAVKSSVNSISSYRLMQYVFSLLII